MTRSLPLFSALLLAATSHPAFAHVTHASTPHVHASDLVGLVAIAAIAALTLGAVWFDRRAIRAAGSRRADR